ncbi:MAG: hypothetical protein HKN80_11220 [Acidimicrobiia bacterium]|nr:hypothetical protein [Acidimicrobiia bacterium]
MALGAATVAAVALIRHMRAPEETLEPAGDGWAFGGERIAFRLVSQVLDRKPREVAERLAARYRPGQLVELVLWVVATDRTGQPWTLVQDRFGDDVPSVTASAVGLVPGACDPYLEAQRLALSETGLALADVLVVGWGSDSSLDARRDAIVVIGQTSVGAEQLGSHVYEGSTRRSHLVELHPDSVARSLASVDARRWQAAALHGLVQCLDVLYPGSGPLVEELVVEPWRNRRMFSRLGRLTGALGDREDEIVGPVVLKVIDGGITEEREDRPVPTELSIDRALSWEGTSRAVPTRYR